MGWYTRHVFPRIMDRILRRPSFQRERRLALAPAYGEVLEVGFGTGLNLPHYPPTVTSLIVLDPILALQPRVARRLVGRLNRALTVDRFLDSGSRHLLSFAL